MKNKTIFVGQILKNKLYNNQVVMVEVVSIENGNVRVCIFGEYKFPLKWMIEKNKTYYCPVENLICDEET